VTHLTDELLLRDSIVRMALRWVGTKGSEVGVKDYLAEVGAAPGAPWCAAFASGVVYDMIWAAHKAELPRNASVGLLVSDWQEYKNRDFELYRGLLPAAAERIGDHACVFDGRMYLSSADSLRVVGRTPAKAQLDFDLGAGYHQDLLPNIRSREFNVFVEDIDRGRFGVHPVQSARPLRGDIVWRPGHCGIVAVAFSNDLITIEGNFGDRVVCRRTPISEWTGVLGIKYRQDVQEEE